MLLTSHTPFMNLSEPLMGSARMRRLLILREFEWDLIGIPDGL